MSPHYNTLVPVRLHACPGPLYFFQQANQGPPFSPHAPPWPQVLTVYEQLAPGSVRQRRRLAVYLEPRDSLFFQAGGRAVAVFDSQADMRRMPPPEDAAAAGAQACVLTPKDVIQCI